MKFIRYLFYDEHVEINEHSFGFDNLYVLNIHFSPIAFTINQPDFQSICKFIFFNISFDDHLDSLYYYDYHIVKMFKPGTIVNQRSYRSI